MAKLIKKGDVCQEVEQLQRLLGINADGNFGPKTEEAVKKFQSEHGLAADGIVGPKTWAALGVTDNQSKDDDGLNIVKLPLTRHITKRSRVPKYLVIHYTAGTSSAKGMATATRNAWQNGNRDASADFVVDDETIVQATPDVNGYVCWSVGDGNGKYGVTNTNSMSIEMCSSIKKGYSAKYPSHEGWYFTDKVVDNTVKLAKYLMKKYNIPLERVIRHYDASRKHCPGVVGWLKDSILDHVTGKAIGKGNEDKWIAFKNRLK